MKYLKLFSESFISNEIYYHGSSIALNTLSIIDNNQGEEKFLGEGIYISNSIDVAKKYAKNGYLYEVKLKEELKSLKYFEDVKREEMKKIVFELSDISDYSLNYIKELIEEKIEDNETMWGRELIDTIRREKLNINDTLLKIGYNSIVCPINKMNEFRHMNDDILNINVIKPNILRINLVNPI